VKTRLSLFVFLSVLVGGIFSCGWTSGGRKEIYEVIFEAETTGLGYTPAELASAMNQTLKIINYRLKDLGVRGVEIEIIGTNRVKVKLPGVKDKELALLLIGRTGKLEFRLVADNETTIKNFDDIDKKLTGIPKEKEFPSGMYKPFSSYLVETQMDVAVKVGDYPQVAELLKQVQEIVLGDYEILFGPAEVFSEHDGDEIEIKRVYLIEKQVYLTGASVMNADPEFYKGNQPAYVGTWIINIEFSKADQVKFAQVTGNNVGERLAIVLDGQVISTPVIVERVPPGSHVQIITQDRVGKEAKDIALLIISGMFPVSLKLVEDEEKPEEK